jgi:hypothetical protein
MIEIKEENLRKAFENGCSDVRKVLKNLFPDFEFQENKIFEIMEVKLGLNPEVKHVHIINVIAKCNDLFGAFLEGYDEKIIGDRYEGNVPDFFPGNHKGDYLIFEIDIETGKILNWNKPSEEDLQIFSRDI